MKKLNVKVTVKQDQRVSVQGKIITLRKGIRYTLAQVGSTCLIELAENVYTRVKPSNLIAVSAQVEQR